MTYEYYIKANPTEWEPCDLSFWISEKFKCSEKTAIEIFNEFVKCAPSDYIYSLCQDKGCGFSEIKKNESMRCVDLLEVH